jgi:hypothetical protein
MHEAEMGDFLDAVGREGFRDLFGSGEWVEADVQRFGEVITEQSVGTMDLRVERC